MAAPVSIAVSSYKALGATAGTTLRTGPGQLAGIFVSALGTTPVVTVFDNTAASGTKMIDSFVPTVTGWYAFPSEFQSGLTVVITGTGPLVSLAWSPLNG